MATHFFGDTAVLLGRSLRHITRSLDTIITTAITPIAIKCLQGDRRLQATGELDSPRRGAGIGDTSVLPSTTPGS
ncbi:hypothetical protein GCM10010399_67010 [Dactylosporangium fulvum]